MRPINLLPDRFRPLRATGRRSGIGYVATGVLAVLLLMVVLYVVTNNGINDAKDKTAAAQKEQAEAQARVGALQAYGNFVALRVSREAAVRQVAQGRFDYERLMREVALVLPHNTYLTSLAASSAGGAAAASTTTPAPTTTATSGGGTAPTIIITGCAPSHPGVATTIVRLRKLHNVSDVDLTTSSKSATGGSGSVAGGSVACPVSFGATLTFTPEAAPQRAGAVPARLGGGQ